MRERCVGGAKSHGSRLLYRADRNSPESVAQQRGHSDSNVRVSAEVTVYLQRIAIDSEQKVARYKAGRIEKYRLSVSISILQPISSSGLVANISASVARE